MEQVPIRIDEIYVPAKRRRTLNAETVEALAESILEDGLRNPIHVRQGNNRFVLVEGLHRLEACRALGEETIPGLVVQVRRS
jgi:ParB-like chromosome segregation protein Spo0J